MGETTCPSTGEFTGNSERSVQYLEGARASPT